MNKLLISTLTSLLLVSACSSLDNDPADDSSNAEGIPEIYEVIGQPTNDSDFLKNIDALKKEAPSLSSIIFATQIDNCEVSLVVYADELVAMSKDQEAPDETAEKLMLTYSYLETDGTTSLASRHIEKKGAIDLISAVIDIKLREDIKNQTCASEEDSYKDGADHILVTSGNSEIYGRGPVCPAIQGPVEDIVKKLVDITDEYGGQLNLCKKEFSAFLNQ